MGGVRLRGTIWGYFLAGGRWGHAMRGAAGECNEMLCYWGAMGGVKVLGGALKGRGAQ